MNSSFEDENPVTDWIDGVRVGDADSAQKLWQFFFANLGESMKRRISPLSQALYDEEDAALSAFQSVCCGLKDGSYPDIRDRNSLWRLLLVIAGRKVAHRHRHDGREQRDRRREVALSTLFADDKFSDINLAAVQPTPELILELEEACNRLYDQLNDESLQQVAQMKLEGYSHEEIARDLGFTDRTIRRKVERIRRVWSENSEI